ncbi:MAG: nicotinamide mononucleotide transporter family protein [Bacteroidia bacterium]
MSPLEWIAALIAFAGVYLNARGRIAGWPLGIIGAALYTWIFYQALLPAESTLQFLYVIMGIYGWWQWSVMGSRPDERPVIKMSLTILVISLIIWFSAAVTIGYFLSNYSLGNTPFIDATLATGGLVTTVLLA